jgi:hypothetical protein
MPEAPHHRCHVAPQASNSACGLAIERIRQLCGVGKVEISQYQPCPQEAAPAIARELARYQEAIDELEFGLVRPLNRLRRIDRRQA